MENHLAFAPTVRDYRNLFPRQLPRPLSRRDPLRIPKLSILRMNLGASQPHSKHVNTQSMVPQLRKRPQSRALLRNLDELAVCAPCLPSPMYRVPKLNKAENCYQQKIICDRVQPTCSNCAKRKNNKAIPCQWFPVTTKRTYKKEPRKRISKLDNELLAAQRRLAYEQYGELAFSLTETQLGVFILGRSPFPDAQMGVPVSNQVSDGRRLTPQGSLSPLSSESKGSSISRQTITSSQTPEQHLCTNCGSSSLIPVTPMITLPHTRSPPSMPFLPAQPQFADPGRTAKLSQAPNTMAPHSEIPGLPNEFSWVFDIHPELQEVSMDDTHAPSIGDFPSNNYDESNLEDILSYEPEPLDNLGTTLYGDFSEDMGAEQNGSLVEPLHDSPDAFGDSIGSAFTTDLNQVRSIESTNSPNYETDSTYYGEMNSATKQAGHTTGIENEQNENELLIEHLDSELFGPDSD